MNYQDKSKDELIKELRDLQAKYKSFAELYANENSSRKLTEQALKDSEERYHISENDFKIAQTATHIGNWKWFLSTNEVVWSDEMFHIFGIDKDSYTGRLGDVITKVIHPDDLHLVLPSNAIGFIQQPSIEYRIIMPDKSIKYILAMAGASKLDGLGNPLFLHGIAQDITDRKYSDSVIKLQANELNKLNSDKDIFITILAHDLRSPFSSILGFLQLLIKNIHSYDDDKIDRQLSIINNSVQNTFNLLEDLLMWINSESGKLPFAPQKLNFTIVCNEILDDIKQFSDSKNIVINYVSPVELIVFADIDMLKTILRNLISNAIKFTNKGGQIDIYVEQMLSTLTVSIKDNGIGIEPEILNKLFDISKTHSTKGTENEKGTGLGLFLCKQFVERHDCKLWVESVLGKGSCFRFTLPINKN